jgi:lysophospholipase L1-like esterase
MDDRQNNTIQQIRVACVGDSITEMSGYPEFASELLGPKYLVGNFGACGSQVSLGSDCSYMYSAAFKSAKNFQPDIIIIMLGTNDANLSLHEYQGCLTEDYLILIREFEALFSKPKIWIVKPPPIFSEDVWLSGKIMNRSVIPALEQVSKRSKLPLIDVYSALCDECYFVDGVHPNENGARLIAEVICKALKSN